jgi:hypothetical protein
VVQSSSAEAKRKIEAEKEVTIASFFFFFFALLCNIYQNLFLALANTYVQEEENSFFLRLGARGVVCKM